MGSVSEAALRVAGRSTYGSGHTQLVCKTALWVCESRSEGGDLGGNLEASTDGGAPDSRPLERPFWSLSIEGWALQLGALDEVGDWLAPGRGCGALEQSLG